MSRLISMRSSPEQELGLKKLCKKVNEILANRDFIRIVEVGSYCGDSTLIINSIIKNALIDSVDPWEMYREDNSTYDLENQRLELQEAEKKFEENIKLFSNIRKNKTKSLDFCKSVENDSIDMVYIDGDHSYLPVKNDLLAWGKKVKIGGILSGHDYSWSNVNTAILEVTKSTPMHVFEDGSWMYVMTKDLRKLIYGE